MNDVARPFVCKVCDKPIGPADRICPHCEAPNPHYGAQSSIAARLATLPPPTLTPPRTATPAPAREPEPPPNKPDRKPVSPPGTGFNAFIEALGQAKDEHVILNVGSSGAGKSWLTARMRKCRRCKTISGWLYSSEYEPVPVFQKLDDFLPRTEKTDCLTLRLEAKRGARHASSGTWTVVDIAGELLSSEQDLIQELAGNSVFFDVLLMALAHAAALIFVVDGRKVALARRLAAENPAAGRRALAKIDEDMGKIVNDVARLLRYLKKHIGTKDAPKDKTALEQLRAAIRKDPYLRVDNADIDTLSTPALLLISKADTLIQLPEGEAAELPEPGPDPTRFAGTCLPETYKAAYANFATCRWGFVAPFVGQPQPQLASQQSGVDNEDLRLGFTRPSWGVNDAVRWLDAELTPRLFIDKLSAADALHRTRRWRAHLPSWRKK